MKKITFLFAFLLSLFGGTQAWADAVTDDFTSYSATSSGQTLGDNWYVYPGDDGSYGRWGSDYTYKHNEYDGADYNYVFGYSSNYNKNVWLVLKKEVSGTVSFRSKMSSSTGTIYVTNKVTSVGDGTFTVDKVGAQSYEITTSASSNNYNAGDATYIAFCIASSNLRLLDVTYTEYVAVTGPGFTVKDGSTKLSSPYTYNFGLTTAGTTKVFTLSNPGTEATPIAVDVTGANGFTAVVEDNATSIPAGEEKTLTITMPDATASGSIVVTPTGDGLTPFTFNVSGTVRDPSKLFEDFSSKSLPEGWYASASNWTYANEYASCSSWNVGNGNLVTPKIKVNDGDKLYFKYKRNYTTAGSYYKVIVKYTTDNNQETTSWTTIQEFSGEYNVWNNAVVNVPSTATYICFDAGKTDIDDVYGLSIPVEPNMVVTQPTSLDYGIISEATAKTFTIANTGLATLEGINVTSSNSSVFAISGAPTSLAAGASQEVTITMATGTTGALSSLITVSATDMDDVDFTVTGVVMPAGAFVVDFNDNALPSGWTNASWTFANGKATGKSSSAYLTTPKLIFSEGDFLVLKARRTDSDVSDYLTVQGSNDNGETWTAYSNKLQNAQGLTYPDWGTIVLTDIPTTVNKLRFVGYYSEIDEITGLTYAPVLSVTKDAAAVTTPAAYDFGECGANATVTYNFANAGAGTINITNVAITGDGAAAYSTNWTTSVAAPFDLVITRTYDAERAGAAQEATVTVTTSEGDFVINVTGTDLAADAPTMGVTLGGAAVATGAAADFGTKLKAAPAAKTYTITNTGTGTLTGTIATSDDTKFTVSKTSFSLAASESTTFDLALVFDTSYGDKAATITIHPTVDGLEDVVINATASTMDPETWEEDFESGVIPDSWINNGWTINRKWSEDSSVKHAYSGSSNANTLTTPRLQAAKDEVLQFEVLDAETSYPLTIKYATSRDGEFIDYATVTESGTASFVAPLEGTNYYYIQFSGRYIYLDDFSGFKLAPLAHDAAITAQSIPTTGNQYVDYTATVTVKEMAGKAEAGVVAKLYVDGVEKASDTKDLTANGTATFTMTFTPDAAIDAKKAYIKVIYEDVELTTDEIDLTIAAATVLNEAEGEATLPTGTMPSVVVKYTPAAGWGTITMPFALTSDIMTSIFGEGWKAYELKGFTDNTLSFESTTTFYAGYPYIVYVETPAVHADGVILKNVNFSRATAQGDTYGEATFQGTYAPIAAPNMEGKWGVTDEAKIAKGNASASINGFRGYFTLPDGASARLAFTDEDGTTTVINALELNQNVEGVYNLQGQKVERMQKGLYIVNGKKVVKK